MSTIWNAVPLDDYERHMQHEIVGQMQLLNRLTGKYLGEIRPRVAMFLGVSGGNGLEHINNEDTTEVVCVDINKEYLEKTKERFASRIPNLSLINLDLSIDHEEITKADLIWAALIFEYVEIEQCFKFIDSNIQTGGYLVATIQVNNGVSSITTTGVEAVKLLGAIFTLVDQDNFMLCADKFGFSVVGQEENILPNKKSLKTYLFQKRNMIKRSL